MDTIQDVLEQYLGDDPDKADKAGAQLLRIFRWKAIRKGIPPADADELASEMCCELRRMKAKLLTLPKEVLSRYVFGKKGGIWHNLCCDWFQRASRRPKPEDLLTPEQQNELRGRDGFRAWLNADRLEDLWRLLRRCIEEAEGSLQQGLEALYRHCWEGTSYEELARAWNVSPVTLRSRVLRACVYLRHQLGKA
jgi:DNA-directed RNA polymerase specialized sigma24 family protein